MPQYRYAYDNANQRIDVFDLTGEDRAGPFSCVSCGGRLIAKIRALKREKHFAHRPAQPNCSAETYLHKLAKEMFRDTFYRCRREGVPFLVELERPMACTSPSAPKGAVCKGRTVPLWYDLTTSYDTARLEYRDGHFIPDLLLTDSTERLPRVYVEIRVTHGVSAEKVDSGTAILEVSVTDEHLLEYIREARLPGRVLKTYNWSLDIVPAPHACPGCERTSDILGAIPGSPSLVRGGIVFEVLPGGTALLRVLMLDDLEREGGEGIIYRYAEACADLPMYGPWQMPLTCLAELKSLGVPVRHCFLCHSVQTERLRNRLSYDIRLSCQKHGKTCLDTTACRCRNYHPADLPDETQLSLDML